VESKGCLIYADNSGKLNAGSTMTPEFIERREAGFYVVGSRVPIDRIVWEYRNGEDPDGIQSRYPTLSLDQVNGAIAFYLSHKNEVEQVMEERRRAEEAYLEENPTPPEIKEKFERMRQQVTSRRG
jgi:uncharacterized protein (DUF433 family)